MLRAITSNAPPTLRQSNWSAKFRGFLSLCLTKDPKERPDATTMLSHPFIATVGYYPSIPSMNDCRSMYQCMVIGGS